MNNKYFRQSQTPKASVDQEVTDLITPRNNRNVYSFKDVFSRFMCGNNSCLFEMKIFRNSGVVKCFYIIIVKIETYTQ